MTVLKKHTVVRIDAPSPLVGEGITVGRRTLGWVRGSLAETRMPKQPLTRVREVYHRAALRADPLAQPPSPTRGEGKSAATQRVQIT